MTKQNSTLFAVSRKYGMIGTLTWYVNVLEPDYEQAETKLINYFKDSGTFVFRQVTGEERKIILEIQKGKTINVIK